MAAKAWITGNITRDPEMAMIGGQNACKFTVAVRTSTKDKDSGNYIVNYYDCTYYGKLGENFYARAQKGTGVTVVGDVCAHAYVSNNEARPAMRMRVDTAEAMSRLKDAAAPTHTASTAPDMDIPF